MDHIRIFSYFIIFIVGIWTIFNINHQFKNYSHRFLTPIIVLLIFFNLMILVNAATAYSCANLLPNMMYYYTSFYSVILSPIYHISVWGMVITFIYIIAGFKEKAYSRKFNILLVIIFILIGAYYFLCNIMFKLHIATHSMIKIYLNINYLSIILFMVIIIWMLVFGWFYTKGKQKKMISAYALFHLAWIVFFFITYSMEAIEQVIPNLLFLLVFNLFPLLWFKKFFIPFSIETSKIISNGKTHYKIIARYNISKREWEVIELILLGKTNKEIEEVLFISFHTVKNHIYSIYQKLGVKSRGALIHLILEEQRNERE